MKQLINIQPKRAKVKYEARLERTNTNVDRFCIEHADDDNVHQTFYMVNDAKTALFTTTEFNPDDFSDTKSESITTFGDLYECACLSTYDRFKANNLRLPYEEAVINWCKSNSKTHVTILSVGSGGLLQEAILAERLKALGITPSFICVDINYPSDPNIEKQRKIRLHGKTIDPNDFYEWMLSPTKPIMIYGLRCIRAIEAFKKHANIQTFNSVSDLAFALENNMQQKMPDLVVAIDLLAELRVPIDTRVSEKIIYEGTFQGSLGNKKYAAEYVPGPNGENRDWGWYNFSVLLLSSGLLKHKPKLEGIVAAYGMIKWFNGVDEVKCEIPLPNVGCKAFGIDDASPEVLHIKPLHVALMKKEDIQIHQFPQRAIIVTPKRAGFIFPENLHRDIFSMFTQSDRIMTECKYLSELKPSFEQLNALPQEVAYRFVGMEPPKSPIHAPIVAAPTAQWLPTFAQFKRHCSEHQADYIKASLAIGVASLAVAYKLSY